MCAKLLQSCLTLGNPWTLDHQVPLSMVFSRQEYWSGLSFPSPGDLPEPGMEHIAPILQADDLPLNHRGSSYKLVVFRNFKVYTDFHSKQCCQPNPHIVNLSYQVHQFVRTKYIQFALLATLHLYIFVILSYAANHQKKIASHFQNQM